MARRRPLPLAVLVGLPVAMLLVGGGAGWLTRDDGEATSGTTAALGVGADLPDLDDQTALDELAPSWPLPAAANPAGIDTQSIIGFDLSGTIAVPSGGALGVPLSAGAGGVAVDPISRRQLPVVDQVAAPPSRPVEPTTATVLPPLSPRADAAPATTAPVSPSDTPPLFVDACVADPAGCSGAPGQVLAAVQPSDRASLAPLQVSLPFAAAAGFADLCNAVEGGNVPEPFLAPSLRPTIAVLVNQPSTLAISGQWSDGAALAKTTLVALPAHDQEWQRSWEQDGVQRSIIACVTLPLADVRAHASAGVATLRADVLAISIDGRADTTGQITLNIPTDDNDPLFVDRLTIASGGEQRSANGVLLPTVHVHYALLTDATIPAGSRLDPATLDITAQHAFVEGADCSGWAVNQQGRDRTAGGRYRVTTEQRVIAGRDRLVAVVDGDVYLDPTTPGGWQGHLCVHLTATDDNADRLYTLALRGTNVRGPRTADYSFGVQLAADAPVPVVVSWDAIGVDGAPRAALCTPATLDTRAAADTDAASACATFARLAPDGVTITLRSLDDRGAQQPIIAVRLPVNTSYCNPDDPFGFVGDGCSPGFSHTYLLPVSQNDDSDGEQTVRVTIQAARATVNGALWQDPAHAWRIGAITAFTF